MFGVDVEEAGRRAFTIDSCLGRGGFGEVYRATMRSPGGLQSEVAVKVLHEGLDPRGQSVQRLRDEGKLLARLDHPAILRVHDLVLLAGRIALVTEFVDGEDLGELCAGANRIGLRALIETIGAVAGALDSAWNAPLGDHGEALRLIHRDIKPSNIRISRHGQVKLLDFGIARTDTVDREAKTQTDLMVGSPAYMAPERFTNNAIDPASDVFALGCTLYEGLVGERLLGDLSLPMLSALALDEERYFAHLRERFGQLPAKLPRPALELLVQMLDYDPARRPTAAEVQGRCEEIADTLREQSLARWCRERPWPSASAEPGPLDGQTITEGTLARSQIAPVDSGDALTNRSGPRDPGGSADSLAVARPPVPAGKRRRTGIVLALVAAVFLGVVVLGAGVAGGWALGAFGGATSEGGPEPTPSSDATTAPAPRASEPPAATPASAPVAEPAPAPIAAGTSSAAPQPIAARRPAPAPRPVAAPVSHVAPAPAPAPVTTEAKPSRARPLVEPAPAVATGHVSVESDVHVELQRDAKRFDVPADVPAGKYEVFAEFNQRDYEPGGFVTVVAGRSYTLVCSTRMMFCKLR